VRAAYLGFGSTDMANVAQLPAASLLSKWLKSTKKAMAAAAAAQYSTGGVSTAQQHACRDRVQQHCGPCAGLQSHLLPPASWHLLADEPCHLIMHLIIMQSTLANKWVMLPHAAVQAYEQAFALTAAALQQPPAAAIGCSSDTAPTSSYMCTSAGDSCSMLQALHPRSCVLPATTPLGGGVVLGCHYRVLQEPWLPVDPAGREFKVHLSLVATKAHIMQQKQQQRQQGKVPAAAGSASRKQQLQQQVPKAVVTLAPSAATSGALNTMQSLACTPPQQHKQQQAASHSILDNQNQLRQPPRASDDSQQQLQTKSSVREALCTTSTNFSLASNISLGSQHLAAAREVLLCSASTDMSGCSLGPVVPPSAGHSGGSSQHARQQQQHQQQQQRVGKARRPQSAPGLGLSSLQPRSWDWDRHTHPAHAAAARPSALQTVQVNWEQRLHAQAHSITTVSAVPAALSSDGASAAATAVSTANSAGSDTAAVGIPAAAGSSPAVQAPPPPAAAAAAAGDAAADAAVGMVGSAGLCSPGKVPRSRPRSASKQPLSQGSAAAAASEDGVRDSALRGSNDNLKPTRVAAWQDVAAPEQQVAQLQQLQDAAAETAAGAAGSPQRQQPGSTLDEEYQEIRDTLQRYQSEYRRQRQHLKQEAGSSH
jgi:hypothetical protein